MHQLLCQLFLIHWQRKKRNQRDIGKRYPDTFLRYRTLRHLHLVWEWVSFWISLPVESRGGIHAWSYRQTGWNGYQNGVKLCSHLCWAVPIACDTLRSNSDWYSLLLFNRMPSPFGYEKSTLPNAKCLIFWFWKKLLFFRTGAFGGTSHLRTAVIIEFYQHGRLD